LVGSRWLDAKEALVSKYIISQIERHRLRSRWSELCALRTRRRQCWCPACRCCIGSILSQACSVLGRDRVLQLILTIHAVVFYEPGRTVVFLSCFQKQGTWNLQNRCRARSG